MASSLDEIAQELEALVATRYGDTEAEHIKADELLIEALEIISDWVDGDMSAEIYKIIKAFKALDKWHS